MVYCRKPSSFHTHTLPMLLDDVSLCDTCPQAPPTEVVRAIMWFPVTYSGEETSSAWERSWGVQTHSSREQEINLCACGSLKLGLCFGSNCGKKLTNPSLCLQAVTDAGGGVQMHFWEHQHLCLPSFPLPSAFQRGIWSNPRSNPALYQEREAPRGRASTWGHTPGTH